MTKQYFQHDYNARNSLQLQALMAEFGDSAYGIFWAVVEVLHEMRNKVPLKQYIYSGIADQIHSTPEKVENVIKFSIEKVELFTEKNGFLGSTRVKRNIIKRLAISKVRAKSGKHGANVKQNLAKERKGNKGKEIKENKEKGIYPDQTYEIELPEFEIGKAIEFFDYTKKQKATPEIVNSLWTVFKIKNFTGAKFYKDDRDILGHFFETLKFQNLQNGTTNQSPGKDKAFGKSAGAISVARSLAKNLGLSDE